MVYQIDLVDGIDCDLQCKEWNGLVVGSDEYEEKTPTTNAATTCNRPTGNTRSTPGFSWTHILASNQWAV